MFSFFSFSPPPPKKGFLFNKEAALFLIYRCFRNHVKNISSTRGKRNISINQRYASSMYHHESQFVSQRRTMQREFFDFRTINPVE